MYPSSSSSSSQKPINPTGGSGGGLTRYVSAPGSLLTNAVDSVIGTSRDFSPLVGHYFSGDSSDSNCRVNNDDDKHRGNNNLQRSYGMTLPEFQLSGSLKTGAGGEASSALLRQKSSPAGFLAQLTADNGFSVTRCNGSYNSQGGSTGLARLNSQLSFTRQDSLSHISEVSENAVDGVNSDNGHQAATRSYVNTSFGMDSWDNGNSIVFSAPQGKRAKIIDDDILSCLNALDGQYSLPQTTLEIASMEKLLNIPEDSVPCKIRAKRGFATHPRSIAERERRTRISGKLKKLQELVPNMDKQTSYADMLDLAVQHIRGLQGEVQKLQKDLESCKCGCKPNS